MDGRARTCNHHCYLVAFEVRDIPTSSILTRSLPSFRVPYQFDYIHHVGFIRFSVGQGSTLACCGDRGGDRTRICTQAGASAASPHSATRSGIFSAPLCISGLGWSDMSPGLFTHPYKDGCIKAFGYAACLYPIGLLASTPRRHSTASLLQLSPTLGSGPMATRCHFAASSLPVVSRSYRLRSSVVPRGGVEPPLNID